MIRVNIILKTGLEQILTPNKNKNTKIKIGLIYINRQKQKSLYLAPIKPSSL